ncbi:urocanate hydratase, partial [Streptomyces fulvoviolaceus]|uniref:urocanate hydratase n=1 Tax=Streptomyces fulvoviolaceus TaxID=285535 RepID=UPI0021BDF192
LVQSGKPVAVLPTHPDAPRVLISTAMVVSAWSGEAEFRRLEDAGLTMYGQMTAAAWFYIGTQGVLGFTHETLSAIARRHFDGTLTGRRVVTAGLGGMGGAQGLAIANLGGRGLIVEADPERARRRLDAGWVDRIAPDYTAAVADLTASAAPAAIALVGNIAEILPRLVADRVAVDIATDQTAAHDLDHGYVPIGYTPNPSRTPDPAYREAVQASLRAHADALLALRESGSVVFEYGNSLRAQAVAAGAARAAELPGFVAEYVRPIFARGVGPYRWVCLSGDPEDLRRSEDAVLEVVQSPSLERWFKLARARVAPQGLPARICWLGLGERHEVGLRLNDLVRRGEIGPLALGRDHMDPAAVASPSRETEGMLDGSDAIADWPVLAALLNAAQGATWVSVGNGGGVGVGRSIHTGITVVADGSELAERKIRRVFWTDPALGVARYADAGYDEAAEKAREAGLDLGTPGTLGISPSP